MIKNNKFNMALLFFLVLSIVQPDAAYSSGHNFISAAGCKTEYFLLYDLTEAYRDMTGRKIQLGKTGNKKAIHLMLENRIDFAFTCEPIEQLSEKLNLDSKSIKNWKSIPIAKDPIVVVANRQIGLLNLSTSQLADIFQGKVGNWNELGGNDMPISTSFMDPKLESGVILLFKEFLPNDDPLDQKAHITAGPSVSGNFVSNTLGAITFMGYNSYRVKYGNIIKIDGVAPTRENILNGTYKLCATYYITTNGEDRDSISHFIDFSRSEEGRKTIEINFIPYSEQD